MGTRWTWRDLLRPGCLLGLAGALLMLFCILQYAWTNQNVDLVANPEMAHTGAGSVKTMVWMIVGVGVTLLGALLSYVDWTRR